MTPTLFLYTNRARRSAVCCKMPIKPEVSSNTRWTRALGNRLDAQSTGRRCNRKIPHGGKRPTAVVAGDTMSHAEEEHR